MPDDVIITKVGKRKVKLTHPDKIMYPDKKLMKAEVISYMMKVSDYILPHLHHRPLTLIRYPNGIDKERFYSKNKPTWTPTWIPSTLYLDDKDNHYIMANEKATLAWLGNIAALEIHPMNVRSPNLHFPDQFIFDLDPSSEIDWPALKELALSLKGYLEDHDYHPFIKTSGGKGLHIYVPIIPKYPQEKVMTSVKALASTYVKHHSKTTTLKISKAKRKGKVLLDIYRNHKAQSCVAPYSLRGKPGAPVSTPFTWDLLDNLSSSQEWTIDNIFDHLNKHGDAWKDYQKYARPLHDNPLSTTPPLSEYNKKRDFSKTIEPNENDSIVSSGRDYVIQLHDASNLHYDLRLEENGVLKSWAIPKGLPHHSGVKRLAVQTEDHPLKYLEFEGKIPKGEYGAGEMWIFDHGQYELIKKSASKYHFKLQKGRIKGEFLMYHTKEDQWIIEKKNGKEEDFHAYLSPMLSEKGENIPANDRHFYEIKWDGIRAMTIIHKGRVNIFSRSGNDITTSFPELQELAEVIEAETAVLDGEIVSLDDKGRPLFHKVVGRLHLSGKNAITKASKKNAATYYLFDLLHLDGKDCRTDPNVIRRDWLRAILTSTETIRLSESFDDGQALFDAIKSMGMEGIITKVKKGKYHSRRSPDWIKIKVRHDDEAYIIGYTAGEGDRSGVIGALHLAKREEESWIYMGKVGTGFDTAKLKEITQLLGQVPKTKKPIPDNIEEVHRTTWIEPVYKCKITYASMSSNDTYREPVFVEMYKI